MNDLCQTMDEVSGYHLLSMLATVKMDTQPSRTVNDDTRYQFLLCATGTLRLKAMRLHNHIKLIDENFIMEIKIINNFFRECPS